MSDVPGDVVTERLLNHFVLSHVFTHLSKKVDSAAAELKPRVFLAILRPQVLQSFEENDLSLL